MRSLFIFILFGYLIVIIQGRPSQSDENNGRQEEMEYEGVNGPPNHIIEGSRFRDEEPNSQEEQDRRLLDLNGNTYLEKNVGEDRSVRNNLDIPDDKPTRTRESRNDRYESAVNDEFQGYGKFQSNRYMENNDPNDRSEAQHLTNQEAFNNDYKNNRMHNNQIVYGPSKRTVDSRPIANEEGELLFGNNREQMSKIDKNDYNVEPYEISQRPASYNGKQYYTEMHPENRHNILSTNNRNNDRVYYSRDRRAAKKSEQKETEVDSANHNINVGTPNENLEKADNENEEMAIRQHIKKLSENELEELFNSLTEEKKALLKKVMDDTDASDNNDNINKREITKKAGAVADNGFVDLNHFESSKIQGSIDISTEYPTPNSELSDATKQSENTILSSSKQETNLENKVELKSDNEGKSEISVDDFVPNGDASKDQAKVTSNEQITGKADKKREINVEDDSPAAGEDPKLLIDENFKQSQGVIGYFSTEDEDLSPFLEDDQSRGCDASKIYKRDIKRQSELENKLKSLEESFPNPDSYDDPAPYSGPLVRVKRTDFEKCIKKRAAGLLPDSKVGFFPSKETDDEDKEEGGEFEDDGFYDPTPNFVGNENNKNVDTNSQQAGGDGLNCILNTVDHSKSPNADTNSGTISLGSDTDNVLSGVEGVNENLMFISGNRNRRKTDGNLSVNLDDTNHIQSVYAKTSDDEVKDASNSNLNVPNYQESDSFGGLSHNYEGDLGRYKRIRRVKQSHVSENGEASSNT